MIELKTFSKRKLLYFLDQLENEEDYLTVYLKADFPPQHIGELQIDQSIAEEMRNLFSEEALLKQIERYRTGEVLFWKVGGDKYLILPPFPVRENQVFKQTKTSVLRQILKEEKTIGVVLVTWGWYAIGIFAGEKVIDLKAGTGYIHPRHRKGGRSEKRFARRTEEQKKDFLRRVSNHIEEKLKAHTPGQVFFGGNRLILKPLLEECRALSQSKLSPRFLQARYATREALLQSLEEINESLVITLS